MTGDDEPREADDQGLAGATGDDDEAVVERLREELDAARERVRDAWQRYRSKASDPDVPAIAASPLVPALLGLLH